MKSAVIYIPGIGDDYKGVQGWLVKTWRLYGVVGIMHEMPWMDTNPFGPKLEALLKRIDDLHAAGHEVSLVGASAGAGAAINAFAARRDKVAGVVCIAGKVNNPATIGAHYRRKNPAFVESAELAPKSLAALDDDDRKRILSRYAWVDPVVSRQDSVIVGAHNRTAPTIGHAVTIVTQLLFGAPSLLRFLKRLEK